ncbi:class I SAM-dependent methyltransferase [Candidatus Omnitrophota bacterium]
MTAIPIRKFARSFFACRAKLLNPIWEVWYWYISSLDKDGEVVFLDYGYADHYKLELKKEDENNRYSIQLYNHIATSIRLEGLDILEVGCGRGGGASYVARYLNPKSVKGIDLCKKSIDFCKKNYQIAGLSFCHGNALSLSFMDNSFDVVINVESSHRYSDMERFLGEVYRVLRPGGYFLFADLRDEELIESLRKKLDNCRLKIIKEEIITPNVIRALGLANEKKMDLIERLVPRFLHGLTKEFAGTKETALYKSFMKKKKEYLHYILQKD